MKNSFYLAFALCTTTLLFTCNTPTSVEEEEKYSITGELTGFPAGTMLYLMALSTDTAIDSAAVQEDNTFRMEGRLEDPPEHMWLTSVVDSSRGYTNILIGNEAIEIKADISDFPGKVSITGSKIQDDYNECAKLTNGLYDKRNDLVSQFFSLPQEEQDTKGKAIWDEINDLDSISKALRIAYIKTHPDTYISLIQMGYMRERMPKDTLQKYFDRYTEEIKASKYANVLKVYLKETISKPGEPFQDFEGQNPAGENVKFSEALGTYTLLDFTAAYCMPCIESVDELKELENNYKDALKIVSFSGDKNKETWLKALERDETGWLSLWDGKGMYGETPIKYGVQGIPSFVLIGPEGIILDKWTGYGKGSLLSQMARHMKD